LDPYERNVMSTFIKKNPWVVLVAAFAVLIVIGIAVS
jgi:uncharacterized membrane protein YdfJ with MMPL/SSD domain